MASLLSVAAGAQEGLEQYLVRALAERRQAEEERSNRATEDYRNRALTETQATRRDANTLAAQGRADSLTEKQSDNARASFATVPAGADISKDAPFFLKAGVPAANMETKPGAKVRQFQGMMALPGASQTQPNGQPLAQTKETVDLTSKLNAPDTVLSRGTEQMREKAVTADRLGDSARATIEAKIKDLEIRAGAAKSAAETAEVRQQLMQAQTELALARAENPGGGSSGAAGLQGARAESAAMMLDRLKTVYQQLQSGEGPGQLVRGLSAATGGRVNLNNAATEYQKLRRATAVALAVAIQGSRPSDSDAEAMAALLPDFTTPASVAENLFNSSKEQLGNIAGNMGRRKTDKPTPGKKTIGRFEIVD